MIPITDEMIAIASLAIPPIEKTEILYIITIVDVIRMLCLKICGRPNERTTVLIPRAKIIRRDIAPCHDIMPRITIVIVSRAVEG